MSKDLRVMWLMVATNVACVIINLVVVGYNFYQGNLIALVNLVAVMVNSAIAMSCYNTLNTIRERERARIINILSGNG